MENLLPLNWFSLDPIDFEHKQYKLFSYLQKCDSSFYEFKFSPYLLRYEARWQASTCPSSPRLFRNNQFDGYRATDEYRQLHPGGHRLI